MDCAGRFGTRDLHFFSYTGFSCVFGANEPLSVRLVSCHTLFSLGTGEMLTIISSFFATRIPFLFVICRYFNPLSTSCCTTKLAFMRNLAPSLMVKGFDFSASTEPGAVRSMVMSGRPSTSRASALMTQRRSSLGSTKMGGDEEMPREAFQRLRDSSFWSGGWSMLGQMFQRLILRWKSRKR